MREGTVEQWSRIIFSDESKFNLYGPDGNTRVWRRPGCELKDHHVRQVVKFGGGSIMVWGAITYGGVGKLMLIDGRMDSKMYIDVLSTGYGGTLDFYDLDNSYMWLQQDNDPKHTSTETKNFIEFAEINTIPWPSCSPDMNPIEHVWHFVDIRLREYFPEPASKEELWRIVQEIWYSIPLSYIRALYESMPRRVEALIKSKGGFTKY